ncbi:hypothetical protein HDV00_003383 [Rhizophlyctis rosea]|nr:hypothetical protein HDV00_003383 [Rhizophlyctis rosea]
MSSSTQPGPLLLHHFGRPSQAHLPGLPSNSGYCLKLETYLRLQHIPYTPVDNPTLKGAPQSKLPFIQYDGTKIADSEMIIQWLEDEGVCQSMSGQLPDGVRGTVEAFRVMIEELYTAVVYSKWIPPENFPFTCTTLMADMPVPWPISRILVSFFHYKISSALYAQGIARRPRAEIIFLTRRQLDAIADQLGDKKWLFGDRPSVADCSLFGVLRTACIADYPWNPIFDYIQTKPNLMTFIDRVGKEVFPEFEGKGHKIEKKVE